MTCDYQRRCLRLISLYGNEVKGFGTIFETSSIANFSVGRVVVIVEGRAYHVVWAMVICKATEYRHNNPLSAKIT